MAPRQPCKRQAVRGYARHRYATPQPSLETNADAPMNCTCSMKNQICC